MRWWRKAAEKGNADGEALLGEAYYEGISVRKDQGAGMKWLRQAAEKGSAIAITFLKVVNVPVSIKVDK